MENGDLNKAAEQPAKTLDELTPVDVIGIVIPVALPGDRLSPEESGKAPFKPPGPGNVKDLLGGPVGVVKGVVLDNLKGILGAQPLSSGDQKFYLNQFIIDAATGVVRRSFRPGFKLTDFALLDEADQASLLRMVRESPRLQSQLAASQVGSDFLQAQGIKLSTSAAIKAASTTIARGAVPAKKGGVVGFRRPVERAAASVLSGIQDLEALLAANPPDP